MKKNKKIFFDYLGGFLEVENIQRLLETRLNSFINTRFIMLYKIVTDVVRQHILSDLCLVTTYITTRLRWRLWPSFVS